MKSIAKNKMILKVQSKCNRSEKNSILDNIAKKLKSKKIIRKKNEKENSKNKIIKSNGQRV